MNLSWYVSSPFRLASEVSRARTHKRGAKPSHFPRSRVSSCELGHYFNFKMASELWRYPIKMCIKLYLKKSF